jgi:NAD+ kinase
MEGIRMKRFTISAKHDETSKRLEVKLNSALLANGWIHDQVKPDYVFTIGGDGTFLHAVHHYLKSLKDVHFVGIHTGTLGFYTNYEVDEIDQAIEDVLFNQPKIEEIRMLKIEVFNHNKRNTLYALNEARVENIIKTQNVHVTINDEYLEMFRGNGLCVSAQAGSTAYNRSINGAVLSKGIEGLQLTEISGIHHRASRSLGSPLIVSDKSKIIFENDTFDDAVLLYDYKHIALDDYNKIVVTLSNKKVKIARFRPTSYIRRLQSLF